MLVHGGCGRVQRHAWGLRDLEGAWFLAKMHATSQSREDQCELSPLLLALHQYGLVLSDTDEFGSGLESLVVKIGYITEFVKFNDGASDPQHHHDDDRGHDHGHTGTHGL